MRILLILLICLSLIVLVLPAQAQEDEELPPPHLGYGVHLAPSTTLDRNIVNALNVDWIKIYDTNQAKDYPDKRILFRLDLHWPENWEQFKLDVATRARELVGLNIHAVEVSNEPNLVNEWSRGPNAWEYVQMLRVAYTAIKNGNPNIIVVSAGLAPTITTPNRHAINDLDFAREMLDNGAAQWFDAFGYHPYGYNLPPEADPLEHELVFRRTERIRALLEQYGVYKQIWLTEYGWLRDPGEDGVTCSDSDPDFTGFAWIRVSGEQQANYLVRSFQYADKYWPWAGPMFVWNLNWHQQSWHSMCSHLRWFSLLRLNGEPTLAYQRFQAMERRPSDYLPRLELRADPMVVDVSLMCLRKMPLGSFMVNNIGYPLPVPIQITASNGIHPPFVEVDKMEARAGEIVKAFVNPQGLEKVGRYPVYINIKAMAADRPFSQNIQGVVIASQMDVGC